MESSSMRLFYNEYCLWEYIGCNAHELQDRIQSRQSGFITSAEHLNGLTSDVSGVSSRAESSLDIQAWLRLQKM